MKRNISLIILVCLTASLILAGCARTKNTPTPSPSLSPMLSMTPKTSPSPLISPDNIASMTPDMSPGTTIMPGNNGTATTTGETANNTQAASTIKAEVDKLSEVDVAHVVVLGNVALVGVEFASQYKGGITDRFAEMVAEKAKTTVDTIVDVVVTDAPDHVTGVKTLSEKTGDIHGDVATIIEKIRAAA